ncbi:hypothetical protein PC41400_09090 [Paenibacillus chitinolyticus]|uniref:Uncharacterized protein n=1 Tax=Paenibacillus chitinolyticus TaxID=79263 RepID=A0A410WTV6_9BACL|nr:hypothetical protein PC41400_09090 [Paenibacillus chitinolyticus]
MRNKIILILLLSLYYSAISCLYFEFTYLNTDLEWLLKTEYIISFSSFVAVTAILLINKHIKFNWKSLPIISLSYFIYWILYILLRGLIFPLRGEDMGIGFLLIIIMILFWLGLVLGSLLCMLGLFIWKKRIR